MVRGGRRTSDRPGRYPQVLVADSYEGARRPCARYLDRLNFDVLEAADGDEALARVVAMPPDVILTEWFLPAMPAPRFAQWLGQSWRTREIPLIALSSTVEAATPAGIAAVLAKPFSLQVMVEEIRRVLREREGIGSGPIGALKL